MSIPRFQLRIDYENYKIYGFILKLAEVDKNNNTIRWMNHVDKTHYWLVEELNNLYNRFVNPIKIKKDDE